MNLSVDHSFSFHLRELFLFLSEIVAGYNELKASMIQIMNWQDPHVWVHECLRSWGMIWTMCSIDKRILTSRDLCVTHMTIYDYKESVQVGRGRWPPTSKTSNMLCIACVEKVCLQIDPLAESLNLPIN